jgi:type IV pilus assembly protein PilA
VNTPDTHARQRAENGFSLVELMMVVLIIVVLMAIAVPTFMSARDTARDRAVGQNVRNALTAVRAAGSDTGGYKEMVHADLPINEPQLQWMTGDTPSISPISMSVTIDNANQVVTIAALHETGDCFLIRDWANQAPGVQFAKIERASLLGCKGDIGVNGAVTWSDGW